MVAVLVRGAQAEGQGSGVSVRENRRIGLKDLENAGLDTDEVKDGVTVLASAFFGTVLKRSATLEPPRRGRQGPTEGVTFCALLPPAT